MTPNERRVAREARTMTVIDVLRKADEGIIKWVQAAEILNLSGRHLLRIRERYLDKGPEGLKDGRAGRAMPWRVPPQTLEEVCRLKKELYEEYSVKHFHEQLARKHNIDVSYTWTKDALQAHGLVPKEAGRGKYLRKRERRPMRGMLLHIDGSTHEWVRGQPMRDLIVMLDDADGRILYARFFEQEGTASTMAALEYVLVRYGRFCELYTDRGSHFCRTSTAGEGPDAEQNGQVSRALRILGINHIRARTPQARGRSERAFRTIQDRLPKELRTNAIDNYNEANKYLEETFVPQFNKVFTVKPAQPESAFTPLAGIDLSLLLTTQYTRIVKADNTVSYEGIILQLPQTKSRPSLARCEVTVHVFTDGSLAVSYQSRKVARYDKAGKELPLQQKLKKVA